MELEKLDLNANKKIIVNYNNLNRLSELVISVSYILRDRTRKLESRIK